MAFLVFVVILKYNIIYIAIHITLISDFCTITKCDILIAEACELVNVKFSKYL